MREIFKKMDWVFWAILTIACVSAAGITGMPGVKETVLYSQAATLGVTFVIFGTLSFLRVVLVIGYTIVKNALVASSGGTP